MGAQRGINQLYLWYYSVRLFSFRPWPQAHVSISMLLAQRFPSILQFLHHSSAFFNCEPDAHMKDTLELRSRCGPLARARTKTFGQDKRLPIFMDVQTDSAGRKRRS